LLNEHDDYYSVHRVGVESVFG
jgi:hypothetical protein